MFLQKAQSQIFDSEYPSEQPAGVFYKKAADKLRKKEKHLKWSLIFVNVASLRLSISTAVL